MGDYRIEIQAVGGHGCDRAAKESGIVTGCGKFGCPDCELREFVKRLATSGSSVNVARLTHWPGQPTEVVDETTPYKRSDGFEQYGQFTTQRVKGQF